MGPTTKKFVHDGDRGGQKFLEGAIGLKAPVQMIWSAGKAFADFVDGLKRGVDLPSFNEANLVEVWSAQNSRVAPWGY